MGPIRGCADITTMDADAVRPINLDDFKDALRGVRISGFTVNAITMPGSYSDMTLTCSCCSYSQVRSSVATKDLDFYKQWNEEFGSFAFQSHED